MQNRFSQTQFGLLLMAGITPMVAYAEIYLDETQAVDAIFQAHGRSHLFKRKTFELSAEEIKKIEEVSGEKVRHPSVIALVNDTKEILLIDQVLGKHEFITYAVGITPEKKIKGIEVMEYRETYGGGVRKPEWRKQFVDKDSNSALRLDKDIINLSGATLSSSHITGGVRRILQTYEVIRTRI